MNPPELAAFLKSRIRTVRDWPKAGINFRDVTDPVPGSPEAFRLIIAAFAQDAAKLKIDLIAAVDARGFIVGGALATQLHQPFVLVRKKENFPYKTNFRSRTTCSSNGSATVEIHADACRPGRPEC